MTGEGERDVFVRDLAKKPLVMELLSEPSSSGTGTEDSLSDVSSNAMICSLAASCPTILANRPPLKILTAAARA